MNQATKAYGKVANQVTTPRQMEADKLLHAASQLQAVRDRWQEEQSGLEAALHNNRMLWSILMTSVTRPENPLPAALRQNVANIGIFVFKQTLETMQEPGPEKLAPLISINREIASGLLGRA